MWSGLSRTLGGIYRRSRARLGACTWWSRQSVGCAKRVASAWPSTATRYRTRGDTQNGCFQSSIGSKSLLIWQDPSVRFLPQTPLYRSRVEAELFLGLCEQWSCLQRGSVRLLRPETKSMLSRVNRIGLFSNFTRVCSRGLLAPLCQLGQVVLSFGTR